MYTLTMGNGRIIYLIIVQFLCKLTIQLTISWIKINQFSIIVSVCAKYNKIFLITKNDGKIEGDHVQSVSPNSAWRFRFIPIFAAVLISAILNNISAFNECSFHIFDSSIELFRFGCISNGFYWHLAINLTTVKYALDIPYYSNEIFNWYFTPNK